MGLTSKKISSKWLISGSALLIVLFLALIIFILPSQKKSLKPLIKKQVEDFDNLEKQYDLILNQIKNEEKDSFRPRWEQEIPDVENSGQMKQLRTLSKLYEEAQVLNQDIEKLNLKINKKTLFPPLILFAGEVRSVVKNTKTFNQKTKRFFDYLAQINNLQIKGTFLGFDAGILIVQAKRTWESSEIMSQLDQEIKQIIDLNEDYDILNTEGLDEDVLDKHQAILEDNEEEEDLLNNISNYLKNKDFYGLDRYLDSNSKITDSHKYKEKAEAISFWRQNHTIKSVKEFKRDWENLQQDYQ